MECPHFFPICSTFIFISLKLKNQDTMYAKVIKQSTYMYITKKKKIVNNQNITWWILIISYYFNSLNLSHKFCAASIDNLQSLRHWTSKNWIPTQKKKKSDNWIPGMRKKGVPTYYSWLLFSFLFNIYSIWMTTSLKG